MNDFSSIDLSIGQGLFEVIFFLSIIVAIIFTIILFTHWKKYAPEPVKIFFYTLVYLIGVGVLLLAQLILVSIY